MDFNYIEKLVKESKAGDKKAKEKIFEEFKPMILNLSKRTFINGYDFTDIKHECYASLLKAIDLYNPDKHRFVGYATTAISNNINYLLRKSLLRKVYDGNEFLTLTDSLEHTIPSNDPDIDEVICNEIFVKNINKYIDKLPLKYRNILKFTLLDNKTLKEYSKKENINYSTTISIKNRALNELRKQLSI